MNKYSVEAVIFDLDGVVTKTALVHAQAWKETFDSYLHLREERDKEPFREFSHEGDYLPYVDGKPRYQGVKSFLESRGINILFGVPEDPPDRETICGIGNKKNQIFREVLKKKGVEVYPSSVEFIKSLRANGIRVGVASSSKNCQGVLQSAGIEDLFETRVDGIVSAQLGLKGKPEGDIFVTAARNLGVLPGNAVVVEDATSGVQAGRNGGFGLVLGIAREGNDKDLAAHGADLVVKDLAAINIDLTEKWFHKRPWLLKQYWNTRPDNVAKVILGESTADTIMINTCYSCSGKEAILNGKKLMLFFDYDGTLTPIVDRPEEAVLSPEMKGLIEKLAKEYTTAIVSGRMRGDVEKLVGIKDICYAGSHGFDISGPKISVIHPRAEEIAPVISRITIELKGKLGNIKGILIEEKKFSTAVHYRLVEEKLLPQIEKTVNDIIKKYNNVRLMSGKKVFEIMPDIDWNKGKAIKWIMETLNMEWTQTSVVYIGDDVTDENAFRAVRTRGTAILVASQPLDSAADFRLQAVAEVKDLLDKIIKTG